MDLTHPLESLVPSLDSATLEVLVGVDSGLGTSKIHRLAGRGSRQGHQKVLDRLVEHGLVLAEPGNSGFLYRFNRDHLLAPAVVEAAQVRYELFKRLLAEVKSLEPLPVHASVFGSVARGGGTPRSDIDLFLLMPAGYADLTPAPTGWDRQLQAMGDRVLSWTGNRLEALVVDVEQLQVAAYEGESVLESIARDAITLHGERAEDLLDLYGAHR
jgi:hypothetical protein